MRIANGIVHVAYAQAGAGRTARLIVARKVITIAAALFLGAFGGGLSAVEVTAILAAASGVELLWSIWDRARTDPRTGADPGPAMPAHTPAEPGALLGLRNKVTP